MSSLQVVVALGVAVVCTGACTGGGPSDHVMDIVFDVCDPFVVSSPEATVEQRAGIERALELWREQGFGSGTMEPVEGAPVLEVRFAEGSPIFRGIYEDEEGVIYINETLSSDHLGIVLSHEMGHAFGLWHVSSDHRVSVMNPGNLDVAPTSGDGIALTEMWGPCTMAR